MVKQELKEVLTALQERKGLYLKVKSELILELKLIEQGLLYCDHEILKTQDELLKLRG